jgi:hypothetical protein
MGHEQINLTYLLPGGKKAESAEIACVMVETAYCPGSYSEFKVVDLFFRGLDIT